MGKIISICNQKGGVGKTTTAVNLGAYLAKANKRALLIDMDPQGNTTSGLGIDKKNVMQSIYDVLINGGSDMAKAIISTQVDNLFLIPSNIDLTGLEVELVGVEKREFKLRIALDTIKSNYDYLLVDCPPSLGLITINALVASDAALIPVQCEYYALEGLSSLLRIIEFVRSQLNPGLEIEGAVLTMADYRTNLATEVIDEIKGFFKEKAYDTVIPRSIRLAESPGFGKPVLLYDPDSIGAQRYKELADEFLAKENR